MESAGGGAQREGRGFVAKEEKILRAEGRGEAKH